MFNKSHSIAHKSRLGMTIVLGFALSAVVGMNVQARDLSKPKTQTRSVYLVKYGSGNDVRYGKNPAGKVMKVSDSEYMNSNPYVCTPSGFGRKARCRSI